MNTSKKWTLLFIKDSDSKFDSNTKMLDTLFSKVDVAQTRNEALTLFDTNQYDIVLSDLSEDPKEVAFLKQLKGKKSRQTIFALIAPKDSNKLFGIADLGINAFELRPAQFEQALEAIANFNPYQ